MKEHKLYFLWALLYALTAGLASTRAGNVVGVALHVLLGVFSAPMFCGQYWVLGLFGWSCLFCAALEARRKLKK